MEFPQNSPFSLPNQEAQNAPNLPTDQEFVGTADPFHKIRVLVEEALHNLPHDAYVSRNLLEEVMDLI